MVVEKVETVVRWMLDQSWLSLVLSAMALLVAVASVFTARRANHIARAGQTDKRQMHARAVRPILDISVTIDHDGKPMVCLLPAQESSWMGWCRVAVANKGKAIAQGISVDRIEIQDSNVGYRGPASVESEERFDLAPDAERKLAVMFRLPPNAEGWDDCRGPPAILSGDIHWTYSSDFDDVTYRTTVSFSMIPQFPVLGGQRIS